MISLSRNPAFCRVLMLVALRQWVGVSLGYLHRGEIVFILSPMLFFPRGALQYH